jgi:hypothetical protein
MAESEYKLHYFNIQGLAEMSRFVLAYARVPFADIRYSLEDGTWAAAKSSKIELRHLIYYFIPRLFCFFQ